MTPAPTAAPLRIVWFGSYAVGPGYPRSETLIAGLRELGHEVVEVRAPLFAGAGERVAAGRGAGAARLAWRQLGAALRLARGWFRVGDHHVVVAGSGGVADTLLLRLLQNVERRPLVHDAFVPLYDTVVRDRRLAAPESWRARAVRALERVQARAADVVLCDTAAHAELLAADTGVARERFAPVPVCQADPGPPAPLPDVAPLRVLLVATYIPLHGVETVVEACARLRGDGVEVSVVGAGQTLEAVRSRAAGVPGLTLVPEFRPPEEIAARLAASHVGLGVFGDTAKAGRVVPLKAALVLAHGRALVTRDAAPARAALGDAALLVPPADPDALAVALARLRDDRTLVARLGVAGRRLYEERFSPRAVAGAFLAALEERGLTPRRDEPGPSGPSSP